jgi:hypothetical protein
MMMRLPGVGRALAAGRIDLPRAEVFTSQLMLLEVIAANAIAAVGLPDAPAMTTGRLRPRRCPGPPASRQWCVTLTDRNGRAVAHGCARAGPGPPGTSDRAQWLAAVTITPLETGTCTHRRESAGAP